MRTLSLLALATILAASVLSSATQATAATDDSADDCANVGFSDTKPASGRFVQVGDRTMVPYTATIPGSKVTYTMVPIRGFGLILTIMGLAQTPTKHHDVRWAYLVTFILVQLSVAFVAQQVVRMAG